MSSTEELGKIESILQIAGLTDTAQQFPEDVLAAARAAQLVRITLPPPSNNSQEPWPAMHIRGTACTG